jgi:hypothetical protein
MWIRLQRIPPETKSAVLPTYRSLAVTALNDTAYALNDAAYLAMIRHIANDE